MRPFSKVSGAFSSLMVYLICLVFTSCSRESKPEPVEDFSLSSTPATIMLVPGGAGQQISVNAAPVNGLQEW